MQPSPHISIIVPVYKEERNIRPFLHRVQPVLDALGTYEILFCLDPSPDRTEQIILEEAGRDSRIGLLVFSRRFGQPAATMAGILNCRGNACVVIDVDLQDPPELIVEMYAKLNTGYDVVYAKRRQRADETPIKKLVSAIGYAVINRISDVQIPRDTGDFRIISRRVIEQLRCLPESHGFLRGLVAFVGYPQTYVEYDRDARLHGPGNYNRYWGSLRIGFNGLFGFSTAPLSLMLWSGFAIAVLSVALIVLMLAAKFILQADYPLGIPTITVLILFIGGVQLMSVGVLGEYIGRIYDEVRRRPHFIINRAVNTLVRDAHGEGRGDASHILGGNNGVAALGDDLRAKEAIQSQVVDDDAASAALAQVMRPSTEANVR